MGWTQSICNKQQEELAPTAIPNVMEVDANVLAKKLAMTKSQNVKSVIRLLATRKPCYNNVSSCFKCISLFILSITYTIKLKSSMTASQFIKELQSFQNKKELENVQRFFSYEGKESMFIGLKMATLFISLPGLHSQ